MIYVFVYIWFEFGHAFCFGDTELQRYNITTANCVSFDFIVDYSSDWGYSLINTLKLKKIPLLSLALHVCFRPCWSRSAQISARLPRACRQHLHACQAGRPRPARPSLQKEQLRKPRREKRRSNRPRACRQHLHACQAGRPRPARPSLEQQHLRKPRREQRRRKVCGGHVSGYLYMVGQENNSTKTCRFIYGRTRFVQSKSFVLGPGTRMIL